MINLFETDNHTIDTSTFSNLLHDGCVGEFETAFCEHVGGTYACSTSSATAAIFLLAKYFVRSDTMTVPSIIPPVVANAILHAGKKLKFSDNVKWVGHRYTLHEEPGLHIIDSAQEVTKDLLKTMDEETVAVYSFYPTKPVGSCDGGIVVGHNRDLIEHLRSLTLNGTTMDTNSWQRMIIQPGWKMYMNSIQATIAHRNLETLGDRKATLTTIRYEYNYAFGLSNTSSHLYRIPVEDADSAIKHMRTEGIVCGKHYEALHLHPVYTPYSQPRLPESEAASNGFVSIPYHHKLSVEDVKHVISCASHIIRA